MKKNILLFALVLTSFMYHAADAQMNIGVNIGSQPVWGPAGYDYAQYYYFPDIDVYYNVPDRQFIYFDGRSWVGSYALPSFYDRFDLYNSYKVVINEANPYLRNNFWHSRYYGYRGQPQQNIYSSRDPRYYVIKEHPMHDTWMAGRTDNQYSRGGNYGGGNYGDGNYGNRRGNYGDGNYDNRRGNYGRNDDWRYNNRTPDMERNDNRRYNNNEKPGGMRRNDRFDNGERQNGDWRQNDNRGWNGARRY